MPMREVIELTGKADRVRLRKAMQPPHPLSPCEAPVSDYVIRPVESLDELAAAFDVLGAQFDPPFSHTHPRFAALERRFALDRGLMQIAVKQEKVVGGALAFRAEHGRGATLRIVAIRAEDRHHGLGRRLVLAMEAEAARHGVRSIALSAVEGAKDFYAALGYSGKLNEAVLTKNLVAHSITDPDERRARLAQLRARKSEHKATTTQF